MNKFIKKCELSLAGIKKDVFIYQMIVAGLAGVSLIIIISILITICHNKRKLASYRKAVSKIFIL